MTEIVVEHIDKLYEPLTPDENRALLWAVRNCPGGFPPALSPAANKVEAQLHPQVTSHRIYEGP